MKIHTYIQYIFLLLLCSFILVSCGKKEILETPKVADTEAPQAQLAPEPQLIDDGTLAPLQLVSSGESNIVIIGIEEEGMITSPVRISGEVPSSWIFEGIFPISLVDDTNTIIAEWYGTADWIDEEGNPIDWPVSFQSDFSFDVESLSVNGGWIRFAKNIIGDDVTEDIVDIAVSWREDTEEGQDENLPDGQSHVDAGMNDYESCVAGGGDVTGETCTTFDGRTFTSTMAHNELGMSDYDSCKAGGGELQANICITPSGKEYTKEMASEIMEYICDEGNGIRFNLTVFSEAGTAVYADEEKKIDIFEETSASGVLYGNNDGSFKVHTKAGEAVIMKDGETVETCMHL